MTTTYSCREIINTQNLNRILKAKKIDHDTIVGLRKLKRRLGKSNQHEVSFCLSNDGENPGRLYPKRGAMCLQSLKKDVRKALTYDTYTDIDMTNAHPTILSQLFKKHDIACPQLDKYISERENLLAETGMPRSDAKQAFIQLMYGGKPRPNATPFMVDFHKEIISNAERILALPENHKYKDMGEMKKPSNALGSALGYLAQDIERECVMTMVKTFTTEGYEVSTIIHDGFLVQSLDVKDEVLRSAEQSVKHLNGYDIKLEKKDLTNFDETTLWGDEKENDDDDDAETSETALARRFIQWLEDEGHRLVFSDGNYYWYDPLFGVYREDFRQLRTMIDECEDLPKRGSTKFQDIIIKQVKAILEEDTSFKFKQIDTTYRKIPFKNGVYDVVSGELIDYNRDMYFLKRGTLDYEPQSEELKKEVYDKIFLGTFGTKEIADYFIKCVARSVAGEAEDKVFYIIRGRSNGGKGVVSDGLYYAFEVIYSPYNSGALCPKRTDGDIEHLNQWKIGLKSCRIAVANERPNGKLGSEGVKSVCSGGDIQKARKNHCDAQDFRLQCQFYLFCNELPHFDSLGEGMADKVRIFTTRYKYLDEDKYEAMKNNKGEVPDYVRKAEPTLKSEWLKRKEVQQALAQIICEAWSAEKPICPKSVMEETKMLVEEEGDDAKLMELIVETGKPEDRVFIKELGRLLKKEGLNYTKKEITQKLTDMGHKVEPRQDYDSRPRDAVLGVRLAQNDAPLSYTDDF